MDKSEPELFFKIPRLLKFNAIIVCVVSIIVILVCIALPKEESTHYRYLQAMLYVTVLIHNVFLCSESFRRDPRTSFYSSFFGVSSLAVFVSLYDALYSWTRNPFITILQAIYSIVNLISIRIVRIANKEERVTFDIAVALNS